MMRTFEQLTASQQKEVERQLQLYMTGAHEVIPPEELNQSPQARRLKLSSD